MLYGSSGEFTHLQWGKDYSIFIYLYITEIQFHVSIITILNLCLFKLQLMFY